MIATTDMFDRAPSIRGSTNWAFPGAIALGACEPQTDERLSSASALDAEPVAVIADPPPVIDRTIPQVTAVAHNPIALAIGLAVSGVVSAVEAASTEIGAIPTTDVDLAAQIEARLVRSLEIARFCAEP